MSIFRCTLFRVLPLWAPLASAFAVAGCAGGGAYVYGDPAVYVGGAPPGVYGAPYVYYYDRPAYFVSGHWYYPGPSGWMMYRGDVRLAVEK